MVDDIFSILAQTFTPKEEFLHWQLWVLVAAGLLSVSMDNITLSVFIPDWASLSLRPRMVYMSFGKQTSVFREQGGGLNCHISQPTAKQQ